MYMLEIISDGFPSLIRVKSTKEGDDNNMHRCQRHTCFALSLALFDHGTECQRHTCLALSLAPFDNGTEIQSNEGRN